MQARAKNSVGACAWSPSGTATTVTVVPPNLEVGTGVDGAAVFDGATEVPGFTRRGTTYTASRSEPAVYNFTSITVEPGITVTWPRGVSVWFKHTGLFWLKSGAIIDGNGRGFAGGPGIGPVNSRRPLTGATGEGLGAGWRSTHGGSGAGHGGTGAGGGSGPGQAYGTADLAGAWTIQKAGSGGGGGGSDPGEDDSGGPLSRGGRGGDGGGAFRAAGQTQRIDGTIRCDGNDGRDAGGGSHEAASGGGGGSGGSILLEAVVLQGAGRLHCDGGEGGNDNGQGSSGDRGDGGVGSGGRIRRNAFRHANTITTSVVGPGNAAEGTSTVGYLVVPTTVPSVPLTPTVVALSSDRLRVFWVAPPDGNAAITAPGTTLTTTREFDAGTGQVTSGTDPNGAVTNSTYDSFGRLTQVLRPGDSAEAPAVTYTYDYGAAPNRLLAVAQDGSADGGRHTVQFYDGLGRLIVTKTELADNVNNQGRHSVVRQLYTDRDLVAKAYVPSGTPAQSSSDFLTKFEYVENVAGHPFTSPTYDGAGRVTQVTAPDGAVTTTSYGDGQRTLTDANGHQRVEYTDGYGRLRRVDEVDEAARPPTTTYAYDLLGNLTSVTDAAGNRTTITYDGLGRKTQVQDPDTGTWTYAYDALGRLLRQTDAVGNQLTFAYDLLGRLTQQRGTPPGGTASTLATHTYDTGGAAAHALGRRTGLTDSSGGTTWTYDQRGRVTGQTQTILGTAYTTGWSYDQLDRPVGLTYPDGEVLTTSYGAHGLPVSAVGAQPYVTGATYSDQLQPLGWTYGNGTTAHFDYHDQANETTPDSAVQPRDYRLKQLTYRDPQDTLLQQHGYRYDRGGNLTSWWQQDRTTGPWRWDASYDERDRLTGASVRTSPTGVPAAFAYTYDASGNITRGLLGAYTYGDPAHVHAATAAGTTHTYTYDANGAVLTRTEGAATYTHGYDVPGRQTSVAVAGGATSSFVYNGDGALVARQVAGTTVAHYAAGGLYEQDPATNTTRKYATFGGRRVAVTTTTGPPPQTTTTVQYLHQDHLGSTGLVTTASGAFAQARFHAPFGAPWHAVGALAAGQSTSATDHRYTGQRSLEDSLGSLYHYQARWYSPVLGRFLSPDPIVPEPGNPQAFNRYSYVYNNPYKYTDPSGLASRPAYFRNSAGELWEGSWVDGRFQGHRQVSGPGDLHRLSGGRWGTCRGGSCTTWREQWSQRGWELKPVAPEADEFEHNCTDPSSTDYCIRPIPGSRFIIIGLTKFSDGPAGGPNARSRSPREVPPSIGLSMTPAG